MCCIVSRTHTYPFVGSGLRERGDLELVPSESPPYLLHLLSQLAYAVNNTSTWVVGTMAQQCNFS